MKSLINFGIFCVLMQTVPLTAFADDYEVTDRLYQVIDAEGIETIHIHCYCEAGFVRTPSENNAVRITVIGSVSSMGYHGDENVPANVSKDLMSFKETITGSLLKLESREYLYIHHAYLIDSLEISAPESMKIVRVPVPWHDLEGRKID